jgi:hypothetical protein
MEASEPRGYAGTIRRKQAESRLALCRRGFCHALTLLAARTPLATTVGVRQLGGVEGGTLDENFFRDAAKFADKAEPRQHRQGVEGEVQFPPIKTLPRAGHVIVVVVVPTLAEGDQREQPAILAGVFGRETALAEKVRERIDGEGSVPEQYGAKEEAPSQQYLLSQRSSRNLAKSPM